MNDTITILTSKGPVLTKRWTSDGIKPYDRAKTFSVEQRSVAGIRELSGMLTELEPQARSCVIRGRPEPDTDLSATTRDLDHFNDAPHHWVCLDVDDWPLPPDVTLDDPARAVSEFIAHNLPPEFSEVTHHWQLSSSAGAPGKERVLKAHLWFWLAEPRHGHELEAWARSLSLPVDITVFRTVQVHYTAAPVIDDGVVCPIVQRSGLTEGLLGDDVVLAMPDLLDQPRPARLGRSGLVDPRGKPGIIGTFCRLYPPARVVDEVLPDVFEWEGDSPSRLTWRLGGGAAGGAVITDDELRIYNSHATDPFEGHAQNMWDLVRHYRFGDLDVNIDPGVVEWQGPSALPSHQAMVRWAREQDDVAAELATVAEEKQAEQEADEERERKERLEHLETLRQGVTGCMDVEALKSYVQVLRDDKSIDETDRNGTLTMAVQDRFKDLGSPQKREDVRRMLRPTTGSAGPGNGPEWLQKWVYVTETDQFFNLKNKMSVSGRGFDAINSHHMPLAQDGLHRESAADWAIHVWSIREVQHTLYAPGQDEVFELLGVVWANEYREDSVPASGPAGEAAVKMVVSHLERLFPDPRERRILLSWMAHNVRHPGRKIRWAPYIYGPQGTGKTFIGELMGMVMGEPNVRVLAGSTMQSPFNGWAIGHALVVVEEVYQSGHLYETEEKLKGPISNNWVDVHKKGKDSFRAPNFVNYLLLSNHPDGIPVGEGDRRYFFLRCTMTQDQATALAEEGYFDSLFDACRSSIPGLRRWLETEFDIDPEFDPDGRAPVTEARQQVIEMSKSDDEVALEGALEGVEVTTGAAINGILEKAGLPFAKRQRLQKLLQKLGFEQRQSRIRPVAGGPQCRVYVRGRLAHASDDEVKRALTSHIKVDFPDDD